MSDEAVWSYGYVQPAGIDMELVDYLVQQGVKRLEQTQAIPRFTSDDHANALVSDIERHPHAFVLASLLDRQMKAESVWAAPYRISQRLGTFEIGALGELTEVSWLECLSTEPKLHRFPTRMAVVVCRGVRRILDVYDGDASRIWTDRPSSAQLVRRFLAFHGAGPKIATMAANILVRDFRIDVADRRFIDISADVQVNRVMSRLGLANPDGGPEDVIYAARDLFPDFPGIFDLTLWRIGRDVCRPLDPKCSACELARWCPSRS